MQFPIQIYQPSRWFVRELFVADATGILIGFVHRNLLFIGDTVNIYSDETQKGVIYSIKSKSLMQSFLRAGRRYEFFDASGQLVGGLKCGGVWWPTYVVTVDDETELTVELDSFLKHFIDAWFNMFPFVNRVLRPAYRIRRGGQEEVLRLVRRRGMRGNIYSIAAVGGLDGREREATLIGLTLVVLLDWTR